MPLPKLLLGFSLVIISYMYCARTNSPFHLRSLRWGYWMSRFSSWNPRSVKPWRTSAPNGSFTGDNCNLWGLKHVMPTREDITKSSTQWRFEAWVSSCFHHCPRPHLSSIGLRSITTTSQLCAWERLIYHLTKSWDGTKQQGTNLRSHLDLGEIIFCTWGLARLRSLPGLKSLS